MSVKLRLIVFSCLFVGWIVYLLVLVFITRHPGSLFAAPELTDFLSRPQFLVSDLYVLAELDGSGTSPNPTVTVKKVYWPKDGAVLENKEIVVEYLAKCESQNGWIGKGLYILPLTKAEMPGLLGKPPTDQYELSRIPYSPGFRHDDRLNFLRIYPATDQARAQLAELIGEYHP
jgi:hypothetical protein